MSETLRFLPFAEDIETKPVLKKLAKAHQALAELKGVTASVPNQGVLINTLSLQEGQASSAIENIITTQDDLYQSDVGKQQFPTLEAKEVHNYAKALRQGFQQVTEHGLLTGNMILDIQSVIKENAAGFRQLPGTVIKNDATGATVYTPPQHPDAIRALMDNLEHFINEETLCDWDPLTKMAVIHHQFESIHPFYDGNGRTGRVINILYLVKQGLLKAPVLYLSRFINRSKTDYYQLLQTTRDSQDWQPWLLYMLDGVEQTARETIVLVEKIKSLMQKIKHTIRQELPKIYSQDLLNNLFSHPYTKIDFVMFDLQVSRPTATRYLDELIRIGVLTKQVIGRDNYYFNDAFYDLLKNAFHS